MAVRTLGLTGQGLRASIPAGPPEADIGPVPIVLPAGKGDTVFIVHARLIGSTAKRQNKTQGGLKRGSVVTQPIFPGRKSKNGPDREVYLRLSGSRRTTDITAKKQVITFPAGTLALGR